MLKYGRFSFFIDNDLGDVRRRHERDFTIITHKTVGRVAMNWLMFVNVEVVMMRLFLVVY